MFQISQDLTFTYLSVKEARLKEIKSEILNSEKLKVRIRFTMLLRMVNLLFICCLLVQRKRDSDVAF